jgi:hypothetical protein
MWNFYDDAVGIHLKQMQADADYFTIPNKVVIVMTSPDGVGGTDLVSTQYDYDSPYG